MIKVVIADDEERICQLIKALIDWEGLGLLLAGIAHNGIEASELVKTLKPDILITDIRMPGCSGLDLIRDVKESDGELEIIIISGYAHFEYAQQAIKYGVGDYLLKPISKKELASTLEKLCDRIRQKRETEEDKQTMLRRAQQDVRRLQEKLPGDLLENEKLPLSAQILKEKYYLETAPGLFQAFWIRMDCGREDLSEASAAILMEKSREEIRRSLEEKCENMAVAIRDFNCIGILNYKKNRQEEIRRSVKNCINQLQIQKNIFRPVTFSAALGSACMEPEGLGASMREASMLIEERIVKGTGRVLEQLGEPSALNASSILERYMRQAARMAEVQEREVSDAAVDALKQEACAVKGVHGYELLDLVYSAAQIFAVRVQMEARSEAVESFLQQCRQCRSAEELFADLKEFQGSYLQAQSEKRENESIRPIRRAKQYIQDHYSEQITLEEVSGEVGLSTAYFSVLFKKTEGEGFAKYLIRVRMEQAKILLRESNLPVAEICRKVGYNDLKHFTHTFEKAVGVKPATYRKLYG